MASPILLITIPLAQNLTMGIANCVDNKGTRKNAIQVFITCLGILNPLSNPNLVNPLDQCPILHVLILLFNLIMPFQVGFLM